MKRPAASTNETAKRVKIPPPGEAFKQTYDGLRPALSLLDIPMSHSFEWKGGYVSIDPPRLREMYDRRRTAMIGQKRIADWARLRVAPVGGVTKGVVYFLWYVLPGKEMKLPQVSFDGVCSAVHNGGFDHVYLILWQELTNLPDGVTVLDGNAYFSEQTVKDWLSQGFQVPHIADYARLLAISKTEHDAAWFYDCDPIHLRSGWPSESAFHGFVFATYDVDPAGGANLKWTKEEFQRNISVDYCKKPRDGLKFIPPCRFVKDAPMLDELCESLKKYFSEGVPAKDYDVPFMIPMQQSIIAWGLERAFAPANVYCIIPYFSKKRELENGSSKSERWDAQHFGSVQH
jgi:hypothetical protein